ncbi:thioredoxin family protein [Halosquirtibacter xylanolyticus]|uniref:thioredoxin family protein n=1 Tax=Halosquirtibacter xylanolyticus TaxID=3374599 RepID=UPI0037486D56|nr:thioredoxin family protein [Prolixibacteraceae bacterium]
MEIKVLGTGCAKCKTQEKYVQDAVAEANVEATVEKEEDIMKIMQYGVMATPAIVIDNEVVAKGRVLSVKEIVKLITQ